jgi:chromosomal replication initiator protein
MITLRQAEIGLRSTLKDEGWMLTPANRKTVPRISLPGFQFLPENRSAVWAVKELARAVLLGRRVPVCPLMLHGPPGSGKTQLTAALLATLTSGSSDLIVRSASAADLAKPEIPGEGFADRALRTCDVLVLEDIQHLPERAANAACDLLDYRSSRKTALVVTANTGPAGLSRLPRRLTSRLAAGLVVQLEPPGIASRRVLLEAAAKSKNVRLTVDALDMLAEQTDGMRAALGLLQNLTQVAPKYPGPLDRAVIEQVLSGSGQSTSRGSRLHEIIKRVAAAFGITKKALLSPSRLRNVLLPRQVAMYLAHELAGLSLPRIGAAFERDHTTVLHACRKVKAELANDKQLAAILRQLERDAA